MVKFPLLKPKETPVAPEVFEAQKQMLKSMEEIEREIEKAEQIGKGKKVDQAQNLVLIEPPVTPVVAPAPVVRPSDPLTQRIESILEEDLTDLYLSLSPKGRQAFKQKGEETLSKIRLLLNQTKVNAKKIFQLIREWLKVIPGVNRFFLEQEAKIKTDKILFTKEHE